MCIRDSQESALEIDRQHLVEIRLREVKDGAGQVDAAVADHDIETPESGQSRLDHRRRIGALRDITMDEAAVSAQLCRQGLALVILDIREDHLRPFGDIFARDALTDACLLYTSRCV